MRRTAWPPSPRTPGEIRREPGDDREQRLNEVIAGYLEDLEAGRRPDRPGLLAQHPDLAAELASFFANREHLEHAHRALARSSAAPARLARRSCRSRRVLAARSPRLAGAADTAAVARPRRLLR